jgi:hypothetical protein
MAAGPRVDVTGWLEEHLAQASPDLLRSMVTTFAEALMGAEADAVCGAGYASAAASGATRTTGTGTASGTRGRQHRPGDPEAAAGQLLPGLAAGVASPGRGGLGRGGRHVVPAGCADPADGEARRDPRHHPAEQVAGQRARWQIRARGPRHSLRLGATLLGHERQRGAHVFQGRIQMGIELGREEAGVGEQAPAACIDERECAD